MITRYYLFFAAFFVWACNNIEDAKPSDRNTFIKFFHGPHSYSGVEVEILPDGYAILGNMIINDDSIISLLIRTDKKGNQVGNVSYFPGSTAKSMEVIYNGNSIQGYLIFGDSIKIDPTAERVGNIEVYSARLLRIDVNGNVVNTIRYRDNTTDPTRTKIDYRAGSIKITDQNEIILLGTYKEDLTRPEKPFVAAMDLNLNSSWYQEHDLLERNYVNGKSIHYQNGKIIWATAILRSTQNFSDSYLGIPYLQEQSTFENFSKLGETSTQLFLARDIQPARSPEFGFGIIGTRGTSDASNKNIFFARVTSQGNFIEGSERYFDGVLSTNNTAIDFTASSTEDNGEALTSTYDGGYVLAGSFLTTANRGNGLRDILLIKVNSAGNALWNKSFGGSGDETIEAIREESDNSLIMCGTNNISGLSSIMLIKTDQHGELND